MCEERVLELAVSETDNCFICTIRIHFCRIFILLQQGLMLGELEISSEKLGKSISILSKRP